MEDLVVLTVLHLHHLLQSLVDLELCIEPGGAGGQHTPVSRELPAVNLQDDVTEPTLLSLQPEEKM